MTAKTAAAAKKPVAAPQTPKPLANAERVVSPPAPESQPAPVLVQYRISPSDFCMSDAMPFSQHWEARIPLAIDTIRDMGEALAQVASRLRPGDSLTVTSFADPKWTVLQEVAEYRVVAGAPRARVVQIGETFKVPATMRQAAVADQNLLSVRPLNGQFVVVDQRGNQIESFVDDVQAHEFAKRENARLRPQAA